MGTELCKFGDAFSVYSSIQKRREAEVSGSQKRSRIKGAGGVMKILEPVLNKLGYYKYRQYEILSVSSKFINRKTGGTLFNLEEVNERLSILRRGSRKMVKKVQRANLKKWEI